MSQFTLSYKSNAVTAKTSTLYDLMVFKVKPDGKDPPDISKFKCRYCGKGYFQKRDVHFINSYTSVESSLVYRLIVVITTEFGWPLHCMDVSNTHLNGTLHHSIVIHVSPPPTVHVPHTPRLRSSSPQRTLRLCAGRESLVDPQTRETHHVGLHPKPR